MTTLYLTKDEIARRAARYAKEAFEILQDVPSSEVEDVRDSAEARLECSQHCLAALSVMKAHDIESMPMGELIELETDDVGNPE